ncbi:MAG TPA: hypothetical protein VH396_17605 [Chitinophagaceae bacterium]
MQTGIHQWLLNNAGGWILFDALFYCMPLLYLFIYKRVSKLASAVAIMMLLINWVYVQCYTLYPSNSIEGHIAWLFFPVLFIPEDKKTFILLFEGLRYFFLFFFVSAAIWKLAQGGLFNISQMSGVLLYQHKELLTSAPGYWQSNFFLWLIQRQPLSYLLYLSATLLELSFIAGFFTKKYDRLLLALVVIFLVMDHLIMRITYYEIAPLALTFMFSKEISSDKSTPGCESKL